MPSQHGGLVWEDHSDRFLSKGLLREAFGQCANYLCIEILWIECLHCFGEAAEHLRIVARGHENTGLSWDNCVERTAFVQSDHGGAGGHRLDRDDAEVLDAGHQQGSGPSLERRLRAAEFGH